MITYVEEFKLVDNAKEMGKYLVGQLLGLKENFPIIGNIAGEGLHLGIDLIRDSVTKERATREAEEIMYACLQDGVALKVIEGNILTMRPALCITIEDCDKIINALSNAFEQQNKNQKI